MLMHAIAHGGEWTHVGECALKVDSGRKIPCYTRGWNLPQQHADPTLYQLSYIPTLFMVAFNLFKEGFYCVSKKCENKIGQ